MDAFRRVARIPLESDVPVVGSPTEGYRMRARLHVSRGRIGFYREGTHELCDAASTHQLLPATVEVLEAVGAVLEHAPDVVQGIEIAENRDASERALHLELVREADPTGLAPLTSLAGVTGISISHAGSLRVRTLAGNPRVTDHFSRGGVTWSLSRAARAFFQGNRFLVDALVEHVVGALHAGAMTDLYAGVGLFSVAAAARGHIPVVAVEGDDVSAQDLRENTASWKGLPDPAPAGGGVSAKAPGDPCPDAGAGPAPHRIVEAGARWHHRHPRPASGVRVVRRADAGARHAGVGRCRLCDQ